MGGKNDCFSCWQCTVSAPFRVVSFNTAEGWSRDISTDVAEALRRRPVTGLDQGQEPKSSRD
jgi:hypothetical protein